MWSCVIANSVGSTWLVHIQLACANPNMTPDQRQVCQVHVSMGDRLYVMCMVHYGLFVALNVAVIFAPFVSICSFQWQTDRPRAIVLTSGAHVHTPCETIQCIVVCVNGKI